MDPVRNVIVLGGGSAGFLAALTLKLKLPDLPVRVIHSSDLGIIGVGEGSTVVLTRFLHQYLRLAPSKFFEIAQPTWKLGLKFIWGPRDSFHYTFGPGPASYARGTNRPVGYFCDADVDMTHQDLHSALMAHDKVFERSPRGGPVVHLDVAYHFENEKFVRFLHEASRGVGVEVQDAKVVDVVQDERGVRALRLASGEEATADLFVDASGFASALLGKALGEPFISFDSSLFNDRAVVGGWDREPGDPIRPYTTCQTMNAGWCWQIEHERRINRGYVYCSSFISDEEAEREFRAACPKVKGPTRVVKFISGRYQRNWVKNVVAIGNATGFVEPLEATALGVIAMQCRLLADCLVESRRRPNDPLRHCVNDYHGRNWDAVRRFLAVHYRYNTRLDTPYWRHCREKTELAGAEEVVDFYRCNGPSLLATDILIDKFDQFGLTGYYAMLLGQRVPHEAPYEPQPAERAAWQQRSAAMEQVARRAVPVAEALDAVRAPGWRWEAALAATQPAQK
jgi:tryptophan 7-halogenase